MTREETLLGEDLASAGFRVGVFRGAWAFVTVQGMFAFFRIPKPPLKPGPAYFLIRVDITGYPGPLTAQLWDARTDTPLGGPLRPHGAGGILPAFSTWGSCLYHPIDRLARDHWPGQFGELAWRSDSDITSFLEVVHALIHDPAYLQSTAPSEAAELPPQPLEDPAARVA